jgi:hypothetical protein
MTDLDAKSTFGGVTRLPWIARNGDGLGTCWGRELALELLCDAGFSDVSVFQLELDMMNDFYVART